MRRSKKHFDEEGYNKKLSDFKKLQQERRRKSHNDEESKRNKRITQLLKKLDNKPRITEIKEGFICIRKPNGQKFDHSNYEERKEYGRLYSKERQIRKNDTINNKKREKYQKNKQEKIKKYDKNPELYNDRGRKYRAKRNKRIKDLNILEILKKEKEINPKISNSLFTPFTAKEKRERTRFMARKWGNDHPEIINQRNKKNNRRKRDIFSTNVNSSSFQKTRKTVMSDEEWVLSKKHNSKKHLTRKKLIYAFVKEHAGDKIRCSNCHRVQKTGRVSLNSIKLYCFFCKTNWDFQIKLPDELIPDKLKSKKTNLKIMNKKEISRRKRRKQNDIFS